MLFDCLLHLPAARKPSVAAIDGLALGGGLEVAMVCISYHLSFGLEACILIS